MCLRRGVVIIVFMCILRCSAREDDSGGLGGFGGDGE